MSQKHYFKTKATVGQDRYWVGGWAHNAFDFEARAAELLAGEGGEGQVTFDEVKHSRTGPGKSGITFVKETPPKKVVDTLTVREIESVLADITYKPDHELKWKLVSHAVLKVWWEFERPNCYNPSEIGVGVSGPVYLYSNEVWTPEQVVRSVFGMTMRLEEHEAREFFLYGDERPFDPHKELI